jgi:hypothetical protein
MILFSFTYYYMSTIEEIFIDKNFKDRRKRETIKI